jgi:hypothetical protein
VWYGVAARDRRTCVVLLEQNIGIGVDITVRLMFMFVNYNDIGVHFACITKKPGLTSVKTGADLAHLRRSSNASIHDSLRDL